MQNMLNMQNIQNMCIIEYAMHTMHFAEHRAFTLNIIKSKSELLLGCICGKFTFLFYYGAN